MVRRRRESGLGEIRSWSEATLSAVRAALERTLDGQLDLPIEREDLVAEVLLRFLALDPERVSKPIAYARRILKNLIYDKIRHLQRTREVLEQLSHRIDSAATDGTRAIDDRWFLEHLLRHAELSPVQEKVLRMIYDEGMTITDVARTLAKNPGTIHRHHHRAIEKLAARASQMENPYEHPGDAG